MMNSKKKALTVLSLAFALSLATTGAVYGVTASAENEPFAIDAGASIKVVGTTDESAVETETGIRFSATVTPEFVSTLGDNDYVGMMIVPSKVITAYNNQDGEVEEDYLQFIADKKGVAKSTVENDVACKYEKADLSTADNTTVYGVIASVKDAHYDDDYQAVAYYVKDGVYNYIGASDASTITQVASIALLDTEFPYAPEEKTALGNILEKSVVVKNGLTLNDGVYELTLTDTDTVDLQAEFAFAGDDLANIGLAVEKGNTDFLNNFITYDETANTLKTNITGEWLDVTVTAYDGNVSLPLAISYEPTVKNVEWTSTDGDRTQDFELATYGASTIDENGGVSLAAGVYSGASEGALGTANVPYIALKGQHGGEGMHVLIDFTGANLPNIAFFTDQPDENTKNIVGRTGFLFSSGMADKAGAYAGTYDNRYNIYGAPFFTNKAGDKSGSFSTTWVTATDSAGVISNVEFTKNPTQKYRLVLSLYPNRATNDGNGLRYTWALLTPNPDYDATDATSYPYIRSKYVGAKDALKGTTYYTTGGVVIYGRPYDDTKIDGMQIYTNTDSSWADNSIADWTGTNGLW